MERVIGVPRAVLAYRYWDEWRAFFSVLGIEARLSEPTSRAVLDRALRVAQPELCLPMKALVGHALALADDGLEVFLPRVACRRSGRRVFFGCPKYMALPDMVRSLAPGLRVREVCIDERRQREARSWDELGRELGAGPTACRRARRAMRAAGNGDGLASFARPAPAEGDGLRVGVVGHPYLVFDPLLSAGFWTRLAGLGVVPVLPPVAGDGPGGDAWDEELNWMFELELLDGVKQLVDSGRVDGLVLASSFACGTAPVVGEVVQREVARGAGLPVLTLLFDEQTGEAGLMTRLESFVDLLRARRRR